MSLAVYPPPHPLLPDVTRWPLNYEVPEQAIELDDQRGWMVLGRDGAQAAPEIIAAVEDLMWNLPDDSPFGSWAIPDWWMCYESLGPSTVYRPVVTIEMRTQAEVEAAAGGTHGFTPFAVTLWSGSTGAPPLDGLDPFNNAAEEPAIRILVREDLMSGGAGPEWAGKAFFLETIAHELGHATMMTLAVNASDSFLIDNVCDLFGKPTSQWNDPGMPWENRVVEGAAEFFKDTIFPGRKFTNRTNLRLPRSRFDDFKALFFTEVEDPYWTLSNEGQMHVFEDQFFFNLGICSFVHENNAVQMWFVNEVLQPNVAFITSRFDWNYFRLPQTLDITLNWNFDPIGTDADPGPGGRWDDLQGPLDVAPGYPVYDFSWQTFIGNPGNHVRVELVAEFWNYDATIFYGRFRHRLGAEPLDPAHPSDADLRYIPPVSGSVPVNVAEIEWALGYSALPENLFRVVCRLDSSAGRVSLPKYLLYPSEPTSSEPQGLSILWPWVEAQGQHVRFPLRNIPWPYTEIPTDIRASVGPVAILRAHERLVQSTGTAQVGPFNPSPD